jgi:putative ABC transport system permease protein
MSIASDRVAAAPRAAPAGKGISLRDLAAMAMRELRAGLSGFYVFIACVALGVMVITAVGALSDALRAGFEKQGEAILGGDVTFARMHARAEGPERAWLDAQGRVSETVTLRTMGRLLDSSDQSLIELKAVDAAYPLAGRVELAGGANFAQTVMAVPGTAAVDPALLERLGLKVGDKMRIGDAEIAVGAIIDREPDGLIDRLTYGPRVLASTETLTRTGLVQPGALVRWRYALKLPGDAGADAAALADFRQRIKAALPEAGFTVADRRDPSPQVSRTLERLRQFLTMLGLASLLVGGVGVANAVATFIDRRRKVIATMKSVGASSRTVFLLFLMQVMTIAVVGILIGVVLGYLVPLVINTFYGDALPIRASLSVTPASVALGVVYGLLVALLFTLWPLGRAETVSPSVLFRDEVADGGGRPRRLIIGAVAAIAALLVALSVMLSDAPLIALYFCVGVTVIFAVFWTLGTLVTWAARRMRRPQWPELALAISNLGAPGGLTRSVVLSLGAGLSLLSAVALADASLVSELTSRMPANSPNYFVLDVPKANFPEFTAFVQKEVPGTEVVEAPMLRGRLIKLGDRNVEDIKAPPEAQWVLNGDRGLTYADAVPEGSRVVAGEWWAADYSGEPLVSFEVELAEKLGVKIGDMVTVNVLGRNISARIANLREVKWENLNLNFVMVFSPNTLRGAPHNLLATLTLPKTADLATEVALSRSLGKAYPAVTAIRVKDAIEAFNSIFSKVMVAVRVAGGVTLLAGALVLAGALATAQRRRILEAVILKTLGATRRRILTAHFLEYALLASLTAVFAVTLGGLAAYVAVEHIMQIPFAFSWRPVGQVLLLSLGLVAVFGGIGTLAVLRARPVPYLRTA